MRSSNLDSDVWLQLGTTLPDASERLGLRVQSLGASGLRLEAASEIY